MFRTPYETTACSSYPLREIVSSLQHALANGELGTAKTLKNAPVEDLREVPPHNKSTTPFSHPVVFEDVSGNTRFAIDTRPFVSQMRADDSIRINAPGEYQFMVLRGMLTMGWARGEMADFASFGDIAPRVFIRLVAESLVRRLSLTPESQMQLSIIVGFYYFSLFEDKPKFDERDTIKVATRISRVTAIKVDQILSVIEPLDVIKNLDGLCQTIKSVLTTPRAELLTPLLIVSSTSGQWFGAASREIMAAALEYPPYLFAMIYLSVNDRGYRNAPLTKLVESVNRNNLGKDFSLNLTAYLESFTHV